MESQSLLTQLVFAFENGETINIETKSGRKIYRTHIKSLDLDKQEMFILNEIGALLLDKCEFLDDDEIDFAMVDVTSNMINYDTLLIMDVLSVSVLF